MANDTPDPLEIREKIFASLSSPIIGVLDDNGITMEYLAKKLKGELEAGETKTLKIKGKVDIKELPAGVRILTSAIIPKMHKEGEVYEPYDDGDTVIQWDEINWGTEQRARIDAHKLRGDYPAERHEVGGKNGKPIEHRIDSGEALRAVVDSLLGLTKRSKPNGDSE